MRIEGDPGDSFELNIVGYQYDGFDLPTVTDKWDRNWLRIHIQASSKGRMWQTVDTSLLTWEVDRVIEWFEEIASGKQIKKVQEFTEPNLRFELRERNAESITLFVFFELECRPARVPESEAVFVRLTCSLRELKSWARDLKRQLRKCPPRGRRPW